jgi:hypothetical protein
MKKLMLLVVCAMALTIGCKNKSKTETAKAADAAETEVAVIDSIIEENDTTPMPMFLMGQDGKYGQMLYWIEVEEPQKEGDDDKYYETAHQRWALQEMFRRNKAQYTNMLMDGKIVKIKFVDEVLKDPDGNTPSIGQIHAVPGAYSLCSRFDFVDAKDRKKGEFGGYEWGEVIVTDAYLQSRKQLPIKQLWSDGKKEKPLPADAVKQLEQRYGMKAGRTVLTFTIGDSCQYGLLQFKGEYKNAPKEYYGDERKPALALDVLILGDKVYANEQVGFMFSENDYSWNVDDEGRYVGCKLLAAFEGPKGLELCYYRGAPESSTVGMLYLRDDKLIEHEYEGYYNVIDEETPVWKKDFAEMRRLYLADDPHSHKDVKLTKWAHCYIDFENEWIWLRDKDNENGAIFLRKDDKLTLVDVVNAHQQPSACHKGGVSYIKFSGSAGGSSYQTIVYAFKGGKRLWKFFALEVQGELSSCMLNDKDCSLEEGRKYLAQIPEAKEITAYFKDIAE